MRYALINHSEEVVRTQEESSIDFNAGVRDGYRWIPLVNTTVDNSTGEFKVEQSRIQTVMADKVETVTTIRDMTAQEIDDRKTLEAASDFDQLRGFALVMLDQINALNARMNNAIPAAQLGQVSAYTVEQMKTAIKNRMG